MIIRVKDKTHGTRVKDKTPPTMKTIFKSLIFATVFLFPVLFFNCAEEQIPATAQFSLIRQYLRLQTTSASFGYNSNLTQTISVTGENTPWTLTGLPDWLTASAITGNGAATITLTAQENTDVDEARAAVLTFASTASDYQYSKTISVSQPVATIYITPSEGTVSFMPKGESKTVGITSNVDWTATCTDTHFTVEKVNSTQLRVTAKENVEAKTQTATIQLMRSGTTTTITTISVTQEEKKETERIFIVTGNGKTVSFKMKLVESGTFTMGATSEQGSDAESDESPTHQVALTNDYYMGETEVTQALWYAVMGQSPTSGGSSWSSSYGLGDDCPAYYISYNDCQSFLTKLNQMTGQTFRFPTEAEWEFAARGGNESRGYKYAGSNTIGDVAWYTDNSGSKTHTVKTKAANELGLYDMSGNVWEWCYDWYGSYSSSAQTDPMGASSGSNRVDRGGGWNDGAGYCRVSYRGVYAPGDRGSDLGLRLAL